MLSPDERQILTSNFHGEMWVYNFDSDSWTRLIDRDSTEPWHTMMQATRATWAPDGRSIAYGSPGGLHRLRLEDSTAGPELLLEIEAVTLAGDRRANPVNLSWSPDGSFIAYGLLGNVWVLPLNTGGEREPVLLAAGARPTWSPDSNWITYSGTESGTSGLWARRFPGSGNPTLIEEADPIPLSARWRGDEIFHLNDRGEMWAVEVRRLDPELELGRREMLFQGPYPSRWPSFSWDVTADGQRFLMKKEDLTHITVVQNWFEDVRRRLGTGR